MVAYTQKDVARLYQARIEAFRRWLALFREADCLTDPLKRGRMLDARGRYQEAVISHAWAARSHARSAPGSRSWAARKSRVKRRPAA